MDRKITITISGLAGHGKSTLADYIASDLKIRHGLNVKLIDDNHEQLPPTSHRALPAHFNADITIITEEK
jgi:ABC-type uncharacterized transport system ATPase component